MVMNETHAPFYFLSREKKKHGLTKDGVGAGQWWHQPLIRALGKQGQVEL